MEQHRKKHGERLDREERLYVKRAGGKGKGVWEKGGDGVGGDAVSTCPLKVNFFHPRAYAKLCLAPLSLMFLTS